MYDLVIRGGALITQSGLVRADLGVSGQQISAIREGLEGRRYIHANGLYVLPGAVDPHVHLQTPVGPTCSSDDWYTGTLAAAFGGTTTVIDFVEPQVGERLDQALQKRRSIAEGQAVIDYSLHMTLTGAAPETLAQIPFLCRSGCPSFKVYLTYEGFRLDDASLLKILTAVQQAGGIVLVHAENDAIIAYLQEDFRRQDCVEPRFHALSRPAIAEGEAVQRVLALAQVAGASVYVVHVSSQLGMEAVHAARRIGVRVAAETCPQYLLLTDEELSRPDFEGAGFVCSPPLRSRSDNEALWRGLAVGDLQTVGTDHCPFNFETQKILGRDSYERIPAGLPGIETRLALLYTFGVLRDRMTLERWVELCCLNPARTFGLYPRKGTLAPGADADIVLFDPHKKVTLSRSILHEQVDYTPYEGFELQGYPVATILRGQPIVENSEFTGIRGGGRYLPRWLTS